MRLVSTNGESLNLLSLFIFHFLTYNVNVYNVHTTFIRLCVCFWYFFIYKAPGSFPFCVCHLSVSRSNNEAAWHAFSFWAACGLDTTRHIPPRKRPWLSSENLNEMKRTRVYRWVRFLHFEVYTYDIPLVVFHLGGIIPETLNNFEMLGATKKKKLVENYSDILF